MPIWLSRIAGLALLSSLLGLASCQAPTPPVVAAPTPANGIGYMVLNAPITNRSRDLFIEDSNKFIDAGATTIHLAINSQGGDIDAAQG